MSDRPATFSYTAERAAYLSIVGAFAFLILVEGGVVALLIALFAPAGLIRLALLGAMTALYLLLLALMLAPLRTRHKLDATRLSLRYGFDLRADIPRSAIVAAQPLRERLDSLQVMRAGYDAGPQRVTAAFSDRGQVLLQLSEPRLLRVGLFRRSPVREVLINVDDRDALLDALGLPVAGGDVAVTRGSTDAETQKKTFPGLPVRPSAVSPASAAQVAIRTEGLTRCFGSLVAVDGLNLAIQSGEIYGFLGPNGAGKTTTMKMLVGLLQPTAGHALIAGHDVWGEPLQAKAALGYVADRAMLYERLSGREFLEFLAQMRGLPEAEAQARIERLLELLDLANRADGPCGAYSFGMKRKLALAGALLHEPPVLILDEPLTGLDPRSARRLKDLLAELAGRGAAIFLSTHDLATAEAVCHRVGIIHQGRLLTEGSSHALREIAAAPDLEAVFLSLTAEPAEEAL